MVAKQRVCKDCPSGTKRPAPHPGPRCATHHRATTKTRKQASHDKSVVKTYGLEPGEYERRYAEQGGVCAICQRAKGITRRLAVDHNHRTGRVRGLLCSPCNQMLGYLRDDPEALRRAVTYLERDIEYERRLRPPLDSNRTEVWV